MIYAIDFKAFFDWKYLIVFITGISFGFLFMLLIYIYGVLVSFRKKRKYQRSPIEIDQLEIEMMIKDAQTEFKDKQTRKEVGFGAHLKTVCLNLATDIAKIYFPTSKYPLLELSVDESILLSNYITERVNDIFSARLVAPLRRRTLAQVKGIYDTKVKIEESKVVEISKKVGAKNIGKTVLGVMNALNPAYWVKKVTVDQLYDAVLRKISLEVIRIVGEETYKIYSKSVFKTPEELYFDIDELYDDITKEEEK